MTEEQERVYQKWNALREKSPMKAYGILTKAVLQTGAEEGQIAIQSISHRISSKYESASNSVKAVKDNLSKSIDEINNYNPFSKKFLSNTDDWFKD